MTLNDYQKLASRTARIEAPVRRLLSAVLGLVSKSGLVAARVQKHLFSGRELNRAAALDELGAQLWYIAEAASALGVDLEEVAQANIDKLSIRYPDGFKP